MTDSPFLAKSKKCPRVRIGFVGCGDHGRNVLLPVLAELDEAEIVAVCDQDAGRASQAGLLTGSQPFTDFRNMLSDCSIDAVIIAGPPGLHFEAGRRALELGKHVFCEKPPARTTTELKELASLATQANVVSLVGHNFRFASAMHAALQAMRAPAFGSPIGLSLEFLSNKPRGSLWDLETRFARCCWLRPSIPWT
jgi:phthalate 4,5-cis-dihydrodiol dehydrogenase